MKVSTGSGKRSTKDIAYDPGAMEHFQRVLRDGGTPPNDRNTNVWLTGIRNAWGGDLRGALLADNFGLFTSYKLNSTNVSKQYAITSASDSVQATAIRQPYLFPYNGRSYLYAGVETCTSAYVVATKNIKTLGVRIKLSGATGATQCTMGVIFSTITDFFAISLIKTGTNTYTIRWAYGGNNFTDTGISLTDNGVYYIRITSASFGSSFILATSTDKNTWTTRSIKTFANWATVNSSHIYLGSSSGISTSYKTSGDALGAEFIEGWIEFHAGATTSFDFSKFLISNTSSFASDGLTFNVSAKSGTALCTQVITRPAMIYYDGSDDKMQSGNFISKTGKITVFALINFGQNLTGTRYFLNESGDRLRVYSDGTNVYVGDSGSVFIVGPVPLGTALLTFVKNGPLSWAQINQGLPVHGDGGSLVPTNILTGGLAANDTSDAVSNTILYALFDGAKTTDECYYNQQLINNTLKEITSTSIW
jgi:hypothetical protein